MRRLPSIGALSPMSEVLSPKPACGLEAEAGQSPYRRDERPKRGSHHNVLRSVSRIPSVESATRGVDAFGRTSCPDEAALPVWASRRLRGEPFAPIVAAFRQGKGGMAEDRRAGGCEASLLGQSSTPLERVSDSSHQEPFEPAMRAMDFVVSCLPFAPAPRIATTSWSSGLPVSALMRLTCSFGR